jgi:hypothetical protein
VTGTPRPWRPGWSTGSGRTQQIEPKTASDNLLREAAKPQYNSLTYAVAIEDVDRLFDAQLEAARAGRPDEVRRLILQLDRAKRRLTNTGRRLRQGERQRRRYHQGSSRRRNLGDPARRTLASRHAASAGRRDRRVVRDLCLWAWLRSTDIPADIEPAATTVLRFRRGGHGSAREGVRGYFERGRNGIAAHQGRQSEGLPRKPFCYGSDRTDQRSTTAAWHTQ